MTTPPSIEYVIEELPPEGPPPRRWWVVILKVLAVLAVVWFAFVYGQRLAEDLAVAVTPEPDVLAIEPGIELTVVIPSGGTARSIAAQLEEEGVVEDGEVFESAIRQLGAAGSLKAGRYEMVTGTPHVELVAQLTTGPPAVETFRLTVIEGLSVEQMLSALARQTAHSLDDFRAALAEGAVTSPFLPAELPSDVPELAAWEGLLAPDTYEFSVDASPTAILQRMSGTLADRVDAIDWTSLADLGLTPYDGVVIASLIEKEVRIDEEREIVGSVITNRLREDWPLEIDAAIIYALGTNPGEVLLSDLEIDSPYNTYLYRGLPPTPISGVRLRSLEAAAAPAETGFYYYVLISEDGTHGFSETIEEHNVKKELAKADGVLTP
jgi:UPF0755 protein